LRVRDDLKDRIKHLAQVLSSSCPRVAISTGHAIYMHPDGLGYYISRRLGPKVVPQSVGHIDNIITLRYSRSASPLAVVDRYAIRLLNHRSNLLTRHQSINIYLLYLGSHYPTTSRSISRAYLDKHTTAPRIVPHFQQSFWLDMVFCSTSCQPPCVGMYIV
jgi:hypothetical protein